MINTQHRNTIRDFIACLNDEILLTFRFVLFLLLVSLLVRLVVRCFFFYIVSPFRLLLCKCTRIELFEFVEFTPSNTRQNSVVAIATACCSLPIYTVNSNQCVYCVWIVLLYSQWIQIHAKLTSDRIPLTLADYYKMHLIDTLEQSKCCWTGNIRPVQWKACFHSEKKSEK